MNRARRKAAKRRIRRGVLTFEWILLISLLVIGIIGGLSAVRNALLCELNDLAECVGALNCCDCGQCDPSGCPPCDDCDDDDSCWWCPPHGKGPCGKRCDWDD